ncbi:MAG: type II secretion system F family protein [Chloroflexi bacterium]|nr:type II secretion system F family protein [Chloroflexota bacterium]
MPRVFFLRFSYKAYTPAGMKVTGTLEADSSSDAEQTLWKAEYTVVSLRRPITLPSRYEALPSLFRVKTHDIVSLSRQMATLLSSGLPVNAAIRILVERRGNPLLRRTLKQVLQDLESGVSLSEACGKSSRVFPSIFVRLVHVGEETGQLPAMLLKTATYLERQGALASRIRKAMVYPLFVAFSGLVAAYILLTYSIPSLSILFKEYSSDLPTTTRIVMAMADFASTYGKMLSLFILVVAILSFCYSTTRSGKKRKDQLIMKLPVIRTIVQGEAISRLGYTLATLLSSGLGFNSSMELTVSTTDNAVLKQALNDVKAEVMAGLRLSQAMSKRAIFPYLLSQMVNIGEETGKLEANLNLVGDYYEKETERSVNTLTAIIEPAAIIGVGGFVGFIAAVMMSTIYGIIRHIS